MGDELITAKDYYLWSTALSPRLPWARKALNEDFLKYEKKRIDKLSKWRQEFLKKDSSNLGPITFYICPLNLDSSWKAAIYSECGDCYFTGLSALQNDPQVLMVALFPMDKIPVDYQLIEITRYKKKYIFNKELNIIELCIEIEDFSQISSDTIYVDVPYEKKVVQKIINSAIGDNQISLSLQSPITSAPYDSLLGGISFSSIAQSSGFAKEFRKLTHLMVPPEYRLLTTPKRLAQGSSFDYKKGMKFTLAERPHPNTNILTSFSDRNYSHLLNELNKRKNFKGEYSIISTITSDSGDEGEIFGSLLNKFANTEITLAKELDAEGADLTNLKKDINEDLWLQVVHSRQLTPPVNDEAGKYLGTSLSLLKDDFSSHLSDVYKNTLERESILRGIYPGLEGNIKRIAQSIARSEDRGVLTDSDFKTSRDLILDNFIALNESPHITYIRSRISSNKPKNEQKKALILTFLYKNPSTSSEIFDYVLKSGLFIDLYDFQRFLDTLRELGEIFFNQGKYYKV